MTYRWYDHADEDGDACRHVLRGITTAAEHRRAIRDLDRHLVPRRDRPDLEAASEPIDWRHTSLSWEQRERLGRAA